MKARVYRVTLDGGRTISAAAVRPAEFRRDATPAVVLAHGAGTSMTHPFMTGVQEGLAAAGFLAVTFNFPYAERVRWPPDPPPVLESTYRGVLRWLGSHRTLRPGSVVIGGRSLGGRIASHVAAAGAEARGLLYLGYPLHPPGQPTRLRAAHLSAIDRPMLFVCGTRDALCDLARLRPVVAALAPRAAVHTIEGADHSFRVPKRLGRTEADVLAEIVRVSADWVRSLAPHPPASTAR
jgi:predicted alpha/beta-hydrolase family hydrolase